MTCNLPKLLKELMNELIWSCDLVRPHLEQCYSDLLIRDALVKPTSIRIPQFWETPLNQIAQGDVVGSIQLSVKLYNIQFECLRIITPWPLDSSNSPQI